MPTQDKAGGFDQHPAALEQHLLQRLQQLPMPLRQIWIGFSGGIDSTALLLACQALLTHLPPGITLGALHAHHGLSPQADAWLQHCRSVCARLGVACHTTRLQIDKRGNVEASARAARYQFFSRQMNPGDLLLLGHHRQDQLETVLQRLFSGRGLLPMRQEAVLGQGRMLRPLLHVPRAELVAYVQQDHRLLYEADGQPPLKAGWIEDASNRDTRLQRNFLRHNILPELQQRWPGLAEALLRVAGNASATEHALQSTLANLPDTVPRELQPQESAARVAWLRAYLSSRGHYAVADRALQEFVRQQDSAGVAQLELQPNAAMLRSYRGQLYFEDQPPEPLAPAELAVGDRLQCAYGALTLQPATPADDAAFAYTVPLRVHTRQSTEQVSASDSARVNLKRLFQSRGIPPWQRPHYPLVYVGQELFCVPGLWQQDAPVAATGNAVLVSLQWQPA